MVLHRCGDKDDDIEDIHKALVAFGLPKEISAAQLLREEGKSMININDLNPAQCKTIHDNLDGKKYNKEKPRPILVKYGLAKTPEKVNPKKHKAEDSPSTLKDPSAPGNQKLKTNI